MKRDRRDFLKIMTSCAITASLVPWCVSCGEKKPKSGAEGDSQKSRVEEALSLMGNMAVVAQVCWLPMLQSLDWRKTSQPG